MRTWLLAVLLVVTVGASVTAAVQAFYVRSDLATTRAITIAELAHRAIARCKTQAHAKQIDVNPFSLIDPRSIELAVETVRYSANGPVAPSRAEFLYQYSTQPEKFVQSIVLLVDLSVPNGPKLICVYNPYHGEAVIQQDFKFPEWYQRLP